ncbi:MAG: hypothetical protein R3228_02635 [Halioglobus sp.]|nr:hypothetical protein [Halioglobus sp.]
MTVNVSAGDLLGPATSQNPFHLYRRLREDTTVWCRPGSDDAFARRHFLARILEEQRDGQCARNLLQRFNIVVVRLDLDDPAVLREVDNREELEAPR